MEIEKVVVTIKDSDNAYQEAMSCYQVLFRM